MAHFARIEDGIVTQVVVVDNNDIVDDDGREIEQKGRDLCISVCGSGEWVQCSYNGTFRGVYPGIGYRWDGHEFITLDSLTADETLA